MAAPAPLPRFCVPLLAPEPEEEGALEGSASLGGKAASLRALGEQGFPVLPGLVLLPCAFQHSQSGKPDAPQRLAPAVGAELRAALPLLAARARAVLGAAGPAGEGDEGPWVVRSSVGGEDGAQASHAGQFASLLSVAGADLEAAILRVWQSAYGPAVEAYRRQHGGSNVAPPGGLAEGWGGAPPVPAVLLQPMLQPCWAGVAFSADPLDGRRGVTVVQAVPGLADGLLAGRVDGELWRLDREGELLEHRPLSPPDATAGPSLPAADLRRIAALTRRLGRHCGHPQDVEWALLADGGLWLLQSRPITTLRGLADPDGTVLLWDNSNIVESYGGVTTPLTFSFARKAYSEVYTQFCRFMGVPASTIRRHRSTFAAMIGFLEGRIYYNLLSWYRVLALLPGYRFNARFLEQMLGVKEPLSAHQLEQVRRQQRRDASAEAVSAAREAFRLGRSLLALVANAFGLGGRCRGFRRRLDRVLLTPNELAELADARPDELVRHYRRIEAELLSHWDAPLINDFYAMVVYGVVRGLVGRWCEPGQAGRLHDWLAGDGNVISAEPPRRIRAMAAHLRGRPELVEALRRGTPAAARRAVAGLPALAAELERYLDDFGDRCMEELKLETLTLREDPLPLLRSLGAMAWRLDPAGSPSSATTPSGEPGLGAAPMGSAQLEAAPMGSGRLGPVLPGRPLRRWCLQRLLSRTRALLSNRENLRFERTRVFGQARRILLELGRRYQDLGLLEQAADVLFLEVEEVLGLVEAHASGTDLAALVEVRRGAWRRQHQQPPLPRRLETRGLPALATAAWLATGAVPADREGASAAEALYPGTQYPEAQYPGAQCPGGAAVAARFWQGIGCAPGRVRGRVSLVADPRRWLESPLSTGANGSILVAASTDPGWVLLFPHAVGLLVERGSVLSHVAIVARELGLPMVTELGGISGSLREGDWVELDGRAGTVRLLEALPGRTAGRESPSVP